MGARGGAAEIRCSPRDEKMERWRVGRRLEVSERPPLSPLRVCKTSLFYCDNDDDD